MAKSYYGFVERDASNFVNYAEVGRNFVNVIEEEGRIREEKKAAIDENTRELGLRLANLPTGQSKTVNEWMNQYGINASQVRNEQDKLLKSGKLKYKDYIIQRQNLFDGTDAMITTIQKVQDRYQKVLDRVKSGEAQPIESKLWEQAEGFGDFTKTEAFIGPDGKVVIGWKDKAKYDGKDITTLTNDPRYFSEINVLNTRLSQEFNTWDDDAATTEFVDGLGIEFDALIDARNTTGATGTIRETLDITTRESLPSDPAKLDAMFKAAQNDPKNPFKGTKEQWIANETNLRKAAMTFYQAETKRLGSYLTVPSNVSSVLSQRLLTAPNGKPYDVCYTEAERVGNPHLIYMKVNGDGSSLPDFSGPEGEAQRNVALEYLRLSARLKYDRKSELKTTPQIQLQQRNPPTQTQVDQSNMMRDAKNFAKNLQLMTSGNATEAANAVKYFAGLLPPGSQIQKKGDKVIITKGGQPITYSLTQGDLPTLMKSIVTPLNTRGLNEDMIVNYATGFVKGQTANLTTEAIGFDAAQPGRDYRAEVSASVGSRITPDLFTNQKSTVSGPKIKSILSKIPGVDVIYSGRGSAFNDITVTYTNTKGEKTKYRLNSNESSQEKIEEQVSEINRLFNDLDDKHLQLASGAPTQ